MNQWFVAKTKPHNERILESYLSMLDVEVFSPMIRRIGRGQRRMEPLFPTYVFCRTDPTSPRWPIVRWTPGIAYILSADGRPQAVSDDLVEYLRDRVERWNRDEETRSLVQGERVRVVAGPFTGMEGMFRRYIPARKRCEILLRTISGEVAVELSEGDVWSGSRAPRLSVSTA